jgi:hypothetical protein
MKEDGEKEKRESEDENLLIGGLNLTGFDMSIMASLLSPQETGYNRYHYQEHYKRRAKKEKIYYEVREAQTVTWVLGRSLSIILMPFLFLPSQRLNSNPTTPRLCGQSDSKRNAGGRHGRARFIS